MAVKFILILVLLQLVSAAPGPDPEPDPDVIVNVNQVVDVSCGCSKCPCDKDEPYALWCDAEICNGTLWNSKEILTGVCAPNYLGYKGWLNLTTVGVIATPCYWQPPHPATWRCDCYINACSNCSCTVGMDFKGQSFLIPGICAVSKTVHILDNWFNHGHAYGCQDCHNDCDCYTPPMRY